MWLAFLAALVLAWGAYHPGLAGDFLFDDYANLPALGMFGPVDDWSTFWRYVTSGTADPTGRPLSMASFLIDARNWPADPYPFKRTNLVLHLLNGVLLFLLLLKLGQMAPAAKLTRPNVQMAAVFGAALWLLHPLLVSTTLYVVQRHAMLPALFSLLGLLAYVHGRTALSQGHRSGAAWIILGLGSATVLATLSKANGVLLPVMALALEVSIMGAWLTPPPPACRSWLRWMRVIALYVPSAILAAYLLARLPAMLGYTPDFRPWTLGERLLTQPRMIVEYLATIIIPRPVTGGLFNDDILVSTSLWRPWTTLPALLAVVALAAAAWWNRRRHPVFAAAILFYFAGHALESTVIPLELYYEHRNYLPAMLLGWPLALWALHHHPKFGAVGLFSLCLIYAATTHSRATLWADPYRQAVVWAAIKPESGRAQALAAQHEMQRGQADHAEARLRPFLARHPGEVQVAANLIGARCAQGELQPEDLALMERALRNTRQPGELTFRWLERSIAQSAQGVCRGMGLAEVQRLIQAAESNPRVTRGPRQRQEIGHLWGRIHLARQEPDRALAAFDQALAERPLPEIAAQQAALLGSQGYPGHALQHLAHLLHGSTVSPSGASMVTLHRRVLQRQGYWEMELDGLRQVLEEDLGSKTNAHEGEDPGR